jgi:DNA-binding response OmpR family regulator
VWRIEPGRQTRTVDAHIRRIRAKLGTAGKLIESVRGLGYRLVSG